MISSKLYKPTRSIIRGVSALVIGGTNSGKTKCIEYMLKELNDIDTRFYIFAPRSHELVQYFPEIFAKEAEDLTPEYLNYLWSQQERLKIIKQVLISNYHVILDIILRTNADEFHKLEKILNRIHQTDKKQEIKDESILYYVRMSLLRVKNQVNRSELSDDEKLAFNKAVIPGFKCVIIIDDLTEVITDLCSSKAGKSVMTKLITKCRHHDMTIIIGTHAPNAITTTVRDNSRIIIWCKDEAYRSSYKLKGYPPLPKNVGDIFRQKYDKVLYNRDECALYRIRTPYISLERALGSVIYHKQQANKPKKIDTSLSTLRDI